MDMEVSGAPIAMQYKEALAEWRSKQSGEEVLDSPDNVVN